MSAGTDPTKLLVQLRYMQRKIKEVVDDVAGGPPEGVPADYIDGCVETVEYLRNGLDLIETCLTSEPVATDVEAFLQDRGGPP